MSMRTQKKHHSAGEVTEFLLQDLAQEPDNIADIPKNKPSFIHSITDGIKYFSNFEEAFNVHRHRKTSFLKKHILLFLSVLGLILFIFQLHTNSSDIFSYSSSSSVLYELMDSKRYRDLENFRHKDTYLYRRYIGYLKNPVLATLLHFKLPRIEKETQASLDEKAVKFKSSSNPNVNVYKSSLYNYEDDTDQKYFNFPMHDLQFPEFCLNTQDAALIETNGKTPKHMDYSNGKNCIVIPAISGLAPSRLVKTILSIQDNWNHKYHYPFVIISGFYMEDDFVYDEILSLDIDAEIVVMRITDVKTDQEVWGTWDYIAGGYVSFLKKEYLAKQTLASQYEIKKLYPKEIYLDEDIKTSQTTFEKLYEFIFEEYGSASIELTNLLAFDWLNLDYFKTFDNFMLIKSGMVLETSYHRDIFENMADKVNAKFIDFSVFSSQPSIVQKELALDIADATNNKLSGMFKKERNNPLHQNNLEKKIQPKPSSDDQLRLNKISRRSKDNIFNGLTLDTHSSVFVSKFDIFRSMEYELFYKYFLLTRATEDDFVTASDVMSLFLALFNAQSEQEGNDVFYRGDLELIVDMQFKYDHDLHVKISTDLNRFRTCSLVDDSFLEHVDIDNVAKMQELKDNTDICSRDLRFFSYYFLKDTETPIFYENSEIIEFLKEQMKQQKFDMSKFDEKLQKYIKFHMNSCF